MARNYPDLTNRRFGRLTVTARLLIPQGRRQWLCRCECGNDATVATSNLHAGMVRSCGCLKAETIGDRVRKHGMVRSSEYSIWCNMRRRCADPRVPTFHLYGGRGIKVCGEWQESFANFFRDMGPRPSKKHTLERKDTNLGYSPENCIWATYQEQQNNRRNNRTLIYRNKTMTMRQALNLSQSNVSFATAAARLTAGWTVADAIDTPTRPLRRPPPKGSLHIEK